MIQEPPRPTLRVGFAERQLIIHKRTPHPRKLHQRRGGGKPRYGVYVALFTRALK